jgi:hypothetical protein
MSALQRVEIMLNAIEIDNKAIQEEHRSVRDALLRGAVKI